MDGLKKIILETPVFPFLWVPHSIIMSVALRSAIGSGKWFEFSRSQPLSCFILGLIYAYPGGILSSLVLGEPLLSFMKMTPNLYVAIASWYLVFYSPGDRFYQGLTASRVLPFLTVLQDWQRIGLVLSGLETINSQSPGLFLYPVVFGVIKSSGFMIIKYLEVGILHGLTSGFRVPNQATKTMVVAAVLLQLQIVYSLIPLLAVEDLYCLLVIFAVGMRLATILFKQADWDPYFDVECRLCDVVYGRCEEETAAEKPKEQEKEEKEEDKEEKGVEEKKNE